jgi:uncharacterized membrane protein
MSECHHKHKVCESRLRTLIKGFSSHVIEFILDFVLFDAFLTYISKSSVSMTLLNNAISSGVLAVIVEVICFSIGYFNERLWNRSQWQRKVIDIEP